MNAVVTGADQPLKGLRLSTPSGSMSHCCVMLVTGLILFWNAPWNPLPLYGHAAILVVAYLTRTSS